MASEPMSDKRLEHLLIAHTSGVCGCTTSECIAEIDRQRISIADLRGQLAEAQRQLADPPRWRQGCTHDDGGVPRLLGRCPRCIREMEYALEWLGQECDAANARAEAAERLVAGYEKSVAEAIAAKEAAERERDEARAQADEHWAGRQRLVSEAYEDGQRIAVLEGALRNRIDTCNCHFQTEGKALCNLCLENQAALTAPGTNPQTDDDPATFSSITSDIVRAEGLRGMAGGLRFALSKLEESK